MKEIEDYKKKISILEEQVAHYRKDMESLSKFEAYTFSIQEELNMAIAFAY
jgi:hypothetical protein